MGIAKYEWRVDRGGHRRYVRLTDKNTRIETLPYKEPPKPGEMAVIPPDPPVVAEIETEPEAADEVIEAPIVEAPVKKPTVRRRRKPAAKKPA